MNSRKYPRWICWLLHKFEGRSVNYRVGFTRSCFKHSGLLMKLQFQSSFSRALWIDIYCKSYPTITGLSVSATVRGKSRATANRTSNVCNFHNSIYFPMIFRSALRANFSLTICYICIADRAWNSNLMRCILWAFLNESEMAHAAIRPAGKQDLLHKGEATRSMSKITCFAVRYLYKM